MKMSKTITQYNQVKNIEDLREFAAMVARMTGTDLRVDQPHGPDTCYVMLWEDGRESQTITTLRKLEDVAEQLERWYYGHRAAEDRYLLDVARMTLGDAKERSVMLRDGESLVLVRLWRGNVGEDIPE
jgi:hypothetical protein